MLQMTSFFKNIFKKIKIGGLKNQFYYLYNNKACELNQCTTITQSNSKIFDGFISLTYRACNSENKNRNGSISCLNILLKW